MFDAPPSRRHPPLSSNPSLTPPPPTLSTHTPLTLLALIEPSTAGRRRFGRECLQNCGESSKTGADAVRQKARQGSSYDHALRKQGRKTRPRRTACPRLLLKGQSGPTRPATARMRTSRRSRPSRSGRWRAPPARWGQAGRQRRDKFMARRRHCTSGVRTTRGCLMHWLPIGPVVCMPPMPPS